MNINETLDVVLVAFQDFGVEGEGVHELVYSDSVLTVPQHTIIRCLGNNAHGKYESDFQSSCEL